jgi:hypothetical protein
MNSLLFWALMAIGLYVMYIFTSQRGARRDMAVAAEETAPPPQEKLVACEAKLAPLMTITVRRVVGDILEFQGILRGSAEEIFQKIKEVFAGEPVSPMMLEGNADETRVLLMPAEIEKAQAVDRPNWALHWLLLAATIATTTWAGALHAGINLLRQPGRFMVGLPYSIGLLLILGAHELGHYFTAKKHGVKVTPPFFIPVPFALGTFGAYIRIKSLTPNRRALFDVAVAGPLAGLVFAIPALLIGLRLSRLIPAETLQAYGLAGFNVHSSILLAVLAKISLGGALSNGQGLLLHPLAFAGWLGLVITALNLLPIGQLDGGHISHALFGTRNAHRVSVAGLTFLFLLAFFVSPSLMMWAFIVLFIAGTRDVPAANDVTPLGMPRKLLAYFAFLLLLLIIVPMPQAWLHGNVWRVLRT